MLSAPCALTLQQLHYQLLAAGHQHLQQLSDEARGVPVLELDQHVYASRLHALAHQEVAGYDQLA